MPVHVADKEIKMEQLNTAIHNLLRAIIRAIFKHGFWPAVALTLVATYCAISYTIKGHEDAAMCWILAVAWLFVAYCLKMAATTNNGEPC